MLLVARLMAEQISQSLIRMMPPGSTFPSFKASQVTPASFRYVPESMPAAEVAGCKFQLPQSVQWKELHLQARRYRTEMGFLTSRALAKSCQL
jgi:hypothetical protein